MSMSMMENSNVTHYKDSDGYENEYDEKGNITIQIF